MKNIYTEWQKPPHLAHQHNSRRIRLALRQCPSAIRAVAFAGWLPMLRVDRVIRLVSAMAAIATFRYGIAPSTKSSVDGATVLVATRSSS